MSCCKYHCDLKCEHMHTCDGCEIQAKWKENEKRNFNAFRIGRLAYSKEGDRFITGCYYCGTTMEPASADHESWVCPQCGYKTTTEALVRLYKIIHHREGEE